MNGPAPSPATRAAASPWDAGLSETALDEPTLSEAATLVAALLAVDGAGLGGVALRASACEARTQWLDLLRSLLPPGTPWRRLPLHASSTALLGGLDLTASLHLGRVQAQPGLLAQAHQGWLVLGMAERVPAHMAAHLCAALDTHEVRLEREGLTQQHPAHIALVALDEGMEDDEQMPAALLDRLAFHLPLEIRPQDPARKRWQAPDIAAARERLSHVSVPDAILQALCAASLALGVDSLRAPLMALRCARALAALEGDSQASEDHASQAVRLVLAPRATRLPASEPAPSPPEEASQTPETAPESAPEPSPPPAAQAPEPEPAQDEREDPSQDAPLPQDALEELLVQAALAALPPGLLAALKAGQTQRSAAVGAGRAGALQKSLQRGRPVGTRRGELRSGARLHLLDTLRAAAPWQRWRHQHARDAGHSGPRPRLLVEREDFHVRQFRQNRPTTTVFVVDASGSAALHRLSEAKGAVELLLAECYVRRDRAAVVAFRGPGAEVLLPPTRSLARAKRSLAALPAGGGTPLATGLDTAHQLALQITRQGESPVVVLLTDGRANLGRDGKPGRERASEDALAAARQFKLSGITALLIDTSAQPQPAARTLAQTMGANYIALPHAGAKGLSHVVQAAASAAAKSKA